MKEALKDYEKEKIELKSQMEYLKTGYYRALEHKTESLEGLI